jgi:predicted nucleic acid-binding protein
MSIIDALDQLNSILDNAKSVPLTGTVILNKDVLEDIITSIKKNYPEEIQRGQTILLERKDIINSAREEASRIIDEAEQQQNRLVEKEEIYKIAENNAENLKQKTQEECILLLQHLNKTIQSIIKKYEQEQKKNKECIHESYQSILNDMKEFKNEKIDTI